MQAPTSVVPSSAPPLRSPARGDPFGQSVLEAVQGLTDEMRAMKVDIQGIRLDIHAIREHQQMVPAGLVVVPPVPASVQPAQMDLSGQQGPDKEPHATTIPGWSNSTPAPMIYDFGFNSAYSFPHRQSHQLMGAAPEAGGASEYDASQAFMDVNAYPQVDLQPEFQQGSSGGAQYYGQMSM